MSAIKMFQGDSYAVFMNLKVDGSVLKPDMISDLEITVGESLRKLYSAKEVLFDSEMNQWYFVPTQEDTLALEPDGYDVQARIKFLNGQYSFVRGVNIGKIVISDALSKEVI